jgi:hypothetical protein
MKKAVGHLIPLMEIERQARNKALGLDPSEATDADIYNGTVWGHGSVACVCLLLVMWNMSVLLCPWRACVCLCMVDLCAESVLLFSAILAIMMDDCHLSPLFAFCPCSSQWRSMQIVLVLN